MIIAEPARELVNFSFWTKMIFVAVATVLSAIFLVNVSKREQQWETLVNRRSIKSLAILTFVIFLLIIVLGRLIAYDHIWVLGHQRRKNTNDSGTEPRCRLTRFSN